GRFEHVPRSRRRPRVHRPTTPERSATRIANPDAQAGPNVVTGSAALPGDKIMRMRTNLPTAALFAVGALLGCWTASDGRAPEVQAQDQQADKAESTPVTIRGTVLPVPSPSFKGSIDLRAKDSRSDFPQPVQAPKGAPNILLVLLDDVGFGACSTFGGP